MLHLCINSQESVSPGPLFSCAIAKIRNQDHSTPHVYILEYDSPVSKIALFMLQGNNRISLYIRRILAFYAPNLVYDTGE